MMKFIQFNNEVRKLIEKNAFVKPIGKDWDNETEARTLASLIAIRKAMTDYPINHAVTFHSSIKKAEAFEQSQAVFSKVFPKYAKVNSYHVSGAMPTSVRGKIVDEFANSEKGIITNAKCLTEGVDVPNIDCVLFADPRKSKVDIIQAVGRALRKKEGKEFGYVILPVFTDANNKEDNVLHMHYFHYKILLFLHNHIMHFVHDYHEQLIYEYMMVKSHYILEIQFYYL